MEVDTPAMDCSKYIAAQSERLQEATKHEATRRSQSVCDHAKRETILQLSMTTQLGRSSRELRHRALQNEALPYAQSSRLESCQSVHKQPAPKRIQSKPPRKHSKAEQPVQKRARCEQRGASETLVRPRPSEAAAPSSHGPKQISPKQSETEQQKTQTGHNVGERQLLYRPSPVC